MRLATSLHCSSQTAQGQRRFRSPRRAVLCPRSPRNTQTARECCLQKCIARPLHAKATVLRECYGINYIMCALIKMTSGFCYTSFFHCPSAALRHVIAPVIHHFQCSSPRASGILRRGLTAARNRCIIDKSGRTFCGAAHIIKGGKLYGGMYDCRFFSALRPCHVRRSCGGCRNKDDCCLRACKKVTT